MMARSNNRTLLFIILVLLVTNGIMLYLLTRTEEKPVEPQLSGAERMIKKVQEELALDSAQVNRYKALRALRDSQLAPIQAGMHAQKNAIIQLLRNDSIPEDSIIAHAKRVGEKQALIELEYFRHFRRITQMLNPDQQPRFDSLLYKMLNRTYSDKESQDKKNKAESK